MFETLLVAGTGDEVRRVERTCKRLGIELAASGGPSSEKAEVSQVLAAATRAGAGAVFPAGLDVLSMLSLGRAVRDAGLVFVGPPTSALETFADAEALRDVANRTGVVVRPSWNPGDRHLEVTVLLDSSQQAAVLVERELSLRNDGDLWVAECPSALFSLGGEGERTRAELASAALEIAQVLNAEGASTYRFTSDSRANLAFVGAEPGYGESGLSLEMVIQADPIELQLELAAGQPVRPASSLRTMGHAFAAHLRATARTATEDEPRSLTELTFPPVPQASTRIETTVSVGEALTSVNQVACIGTFAPIRHQALLGLDRILAETRIAPVPTNLAALRRALNHDSFRAGQYDAAFVGRIGTAGPR